MTLDPFGWVVSLQNRVGYRSGYGLRPPPINTEHFADQAEAGARKQELLRQCPDPDVLVCVTPALSRRPKRLR